MHTRRRLGFVMVAAGAIIVIVIGILLAHSNNHQQAPTTPKTFNTQPQTGLVVLSNINDLSTWINTGHLEATEKALYSYVKKYAKAPAASYTGSIRPDTFTTTYNQYNGTNIPDVQFVVDIPAAQQSYVVSQDGGSGYPYDILHVSCPSTDQLKYGDFGCVNEDQ